MAEDNVERLPTDASIAQAIRGDMQEPMAKICESMNRARAAGLVVNFTFAPDQYGRFRVPDISVVKPLL